MENEYFKLDNTHNISLKVNGFLTESKVLKKRIKSLSVGEIIDIIDRKIRDNALDYEVTISLINHENKRDEIIKLLNEKGYAVSGNKYDNHFIRINW